jgi:hypothetical protein
MMPKVEKLKRPNSMSRIITRCFLKEGVLLRLLVIFLSSSLCDVSRFSLAYFHMVGNRKG